MELPVRFIWSHDAFRVGEDGPTHQPIEQEAQLRLLEKVKNHSNHNAMLVLRPADVEETTQAWKLAIENTNGPTGLIFSRQNIENLPEGNDYSQVARGGYIVAGSDDNPDVILIASGSEVSTLVAGAKLLREDGVRVRIVSVKDSSAISLLAINSRCCLSARRSLPSPQVFLLLCGVW